MATPRYLLVVGAMFLFIDGCFSFPEIKPWNHINAKEDLPIGHSLGTFYVEDLEHPGSTFRISLIPSKDNPLNLMILNGTHFNLTLSEALDREASSLKYISVEVNGIQLTMYLSILDVNDVHPQFQNLPYTVSLPEDSTPHSLTYSKISATDPDEGIGGQFTFELKAQIVEYQNTFIMKNTNDGKVYLNKLLDFESVNVYHYFVIATDGGQLNSTADLFITVTDIQDSAPYFNGIPYMTAINENTNIGTVISGLQVKAADGDKGKPNPVTYSILKDTCQNAFAINNITGNITVKTSLDRDEGILVENNGICQLTVVAQETPMSLPANSSTTSVRITVTDLNDNSPTFNSDHYTANISENMPAGIPVTFEQNMNVSDKDQGDNSNFDLTLEPSNVFDIIPNNVQSLASILIRVKNENALDYEKNTSFVITVTAKESKTNLKRRSSATVTINVIDVNDNAPQFSEALSNISVSENITNGSPIITFHATDADSGDFGDVTYSLQVDDEAFTINSKTGEIRTAKELDREIRSTYFLTVVAKDGGGRRNSRQLSIIVTDVNDNSPHFLQLSYAANIKENSKVFVPTLTVSANDDDVGENGRVTYSIVAATPEVLSNFSIDNHNGSITVKNNLDYEGLMNTNGEITLTVEASDNGTPPKYENVTVFIRVQDINDNTPAFNQRNFTATVAENATPAQSTTGNPIRNTTAGGYVTRSDVVCSATSFTFAIPDTVLPQHNVTLRDPACVVVFNGSHYVATVGLNDCGTTVQFTKDSVIFRNELSAHVSHYNFRPGPVSFGDAGNLFIPVECVYPRRANVSMAYLPLHSKLRIFEKRYGHLDFELTEFSDDQFQSEIPSTSLPKQLPLNQELHIKLSIGHSSSSKIGIYVDNCLATPTPSPNYPVFWPLLKNGCSYQPELHVHHSSSLSEFLFSFNAFKFVSTNPMNMPSLVYVHCQVSACYLANCATSCQGQGQTHSRRRRGAMTHSSHLVSTGPFILLKDQESSPQSAGVIVSTSVAAVACLVAVVAVVAWRINRTNQQKYHVVQHDLEH